MDLLIRARSSDSGDNILCQIQYLRTYDSSAGLYDLTIG